MSRYRKGDVVWADYAFFDQAKGHFDFKPRPFVVIDIDEDTLNVALICSTKTHQSFRYKGFVIRQDSDEAIQMGLLEDTFIYLDRTVALTDREIRRRIGSCPIIDKLIEQLRLG